MTSRIVDNKVEKLGDALTKEFRDLADIAVATAFFDVRGFGVLEAGLGDKPLRLLVGHEPVESLKWKEQALKELEAKLEEDLFENEDNSSYFELVERAVRYFSDLKRLVRLYTRGVFHSKAYLAASPSLEKVERGVAVVGSSNFTYGGLVSNRELNMLDTDRGAVVGLAKWFEEHWNASEDFKEEFLRMLSSYVTTWTPVEVVAKAIYETYRDSIEGDDKSTPSKVLMQHQLVSYRQCLAKLERYGGVVLADSTGLGKTRVMYMLGLNAASQGKKVLVVAPKSVLDTTWREEFEERQMFKHINIEKISSDPDVLYDPRYRDCNFIIIDEAHWLRNPFSKRYVAIRDYIKKNKAQVVLATATPVNNSLMDLYHLFALYAKEDCVFDLTGQTLRDFFVANQKRWLNHEPLQNMDEVLSRLMVRHSRQGAIALSKGDPRLKFPERVLDNDPDTKYPTSVEYEKIEQIFSSMNLSFYDLTIDRLSGLLKTPEGKPLEEFVQERKKEKLKELVKTIVLLNLFKRLESGYAAYRATLRSLDEYMEKAARWAREKHVFVPPRMRGEPLFNLDEELPEPEELFSKQKYAKYLERCALSAQEAEEFARKCDEDRVKLRYLLQLVPEDDDQDPKFQALATKLRKLASEISPGSKNGVLVFTQYRDTALFLYCAIGKLGLGLPLMLVTGTEAKDENGRNREEADIILRFKDKGGILISTDVLSEGQNLQNAQFVVNYDFPWNPVVIIQRIGRVDRLGSLHEKVYVANMLPKNGDPDDPTSLEHFLGIMQKLYLKLVAIRETVGLDASTLGEEAEPKDFDVQLRLARGDVSVLTKLRQEIEQFVTDPIDALAKIIAIKGQDWLRTIPTGIGAYKEAERYGVFALFTDGKGNHYWRLKYFDGKHETITSKSEIVNVLLAGENLENIDNDKRRGKKIDYKELTKLLADLKKDLLADLERAQRQAQTLEGVPASVSRDIDEVYNALSKLGPEGEKLAAMFRKRANDTALVKTLKDALKKGKLQEEAEKVLRETDQNDQSPANQQPTTSTTQPKLRRVCWCILRKKDTQE